MTMSTAQIITDAVDAALDAHKEAQIAWLENRNPNTPAKPRPLAQIIADAAREAARTALSLIDAPTTVDAPTEPTPEQERTGKTTIVTIQRSQYVRQTDTYALAMSEQDALDLIERMGDEGISVDYTVEGDHVGHVIDEADNPEMTVAISTTIDGQVREADIAVD